MVYFRYTAIDANGKRLDGTIRARSESEAKGELAARGFTQVQLAGRERDGSSTSSAPPVVYIRTARARDSDLFFLFSQAASLIKAGFNPFDAFEQLSNRVHHKDLRRACREISEAANDGRRISDVMQAYIDLFPYNAVAMVRAGEYGGFLEEAFERLADHYADSTAFKRWFWITRLATWQGLIGLALATPVPIAFWTGLFAGNASSLWSRYFSILFQYTLPIGGALFLLYYIIRSMLLRPEMTAFRHRFILRCPYGIGSRARSESLETFLWTLARLSRGGVAPGTSWTLAAASVPNAAMAQNLVAAGESLGAERPLSLAFSQTKFFPTDYDALIRTAEQTGDIVATLERMHSMTTEEFDQSRLKAAAGLASIGCLILVLGSGAMMIYLVHGCYSGIPEKIDSWMESP